LRQLVLLNRLKADSHVRRAIRLQGGGRGGLWPYQAPPTIMARETTMVRVGFAGLAAYRQSAQVELDKRADQLADRVDKIKERGLGTIGKHDKVLDGIEGQIDQMDAMVREGSNNAPDGPLPGSPSPSGT
jgi:hypothetical protein